MMPMWAFMVAAMGVAMVGCSSNDEVEPTGDKVEARILAGLSTGQSRASGSVWNEDEIGVMVVDAPNSDMETMYRNVKYTTTSTGEYAEFTCPTGAGIFFQEANEVVTFAAYSPYQVSAADALPNGDGLIAINTETDNTPDNVESIDFIYAKGATASRTSPTVTFANSGAGSDYSFHHVMSMLTVIIEPSLEDGFTASDIDKVTDVTLKGVAHTGKFDITQGKAMLNDATTAKDISLNNWSVYNWTNYNLSGQSCKQYSGLLIPQTPSGGTIGFEVTVDGETYEVKDITATFEPGKLYLYSLKVKKTGIGLTGATITDWEVGSETSLDAVQKVDPLTKYEPYTVVETSSIYFDIWDSGTYLATGDYNGKIIDVHGDNPTIILKDAHIWDQSWGIFMEPNTSATIILMGENRIESYVGGICSKDGCNVTIDGSEGGSLAINSISSGSCIGGESFETITIRNAKLNVISYNGSCIGLNRNESPMPGRFSLDFSGGTINIINSDITGSLNKGTVIGAGYNNDGNNTINAINITLMEGQTKEGFLSKLTTNSGVKVGGFGNIGDYGHSVVNSIKWYNYDGSEISD